LSDTTFRDANLSGANLSDTDLTRANLVGANLSGTVLNGSRIYGISAWDTSLCQNNAKRQGLIITTPNEPEISVDDIEVAQFVYLLLNRKKLRNVINAVTQKGVLILGRFTSKRKRVLDAIAAELRTMDLVPIIFDFKPSEDQDIIETVKTLASLSKFIIADVTAARVIADELRSFVPDFAVPVVPVFQPSKKEPKPYASLYTLRKYPWVLEPVLYKSKKNLIEQLPDEVIKPAEDKRLEVRKLKKGYFV
jgi:hypothetical protein